MASSETTRKTKVLYDHGQNSKGKASDSGTQNKTSQSGESSTKNGESVRVSNNTGGKTSITNVNKAFQISFTVKIQGGLQGTSTGGGSTSCQ